MKQEELFRALGDMQVENNIMTLISNGTTNTITFTIGWKEEFQVVYRPKTILVKHTWQDKIDNKNKTKENSKQFSIDEKDLLNKIFELKCN